MSALIIKKLETVMNRDTPESMRRTIFRIASLVLVLVLAVVSISARPKKPKSKTSSSSSFAYYMLVLSYAPDFCDETPAQKNSAECRPGNKFGFVVHGLWPQGETTRGPENCKDSGGPSSDLVQSMLKYFPTEDLIHHEWTTHGTCSGLSADEYFSAVKKARDSVTIPDSLASTSRQSLAPADVVGQVAAANSTFPKTAFRTSCYTKGSELKEIRICLAKDLTPRACGSSAGTCSLPKVTLLAVH